ncbi:CHAT domain-containing protein [Ornithinimicrobium sp. F0845]|uniref:CHAT domain-containing protein n=1 Tax=Ornithinimicrobium sp. F0845 TaxID=2926412 RepID=UPI001FF22D67|nr:CHAT domain-containing protein [Ornithinimicrobium sp. F0845]MCK0113172.1 CHAT domain-containing protein [Ornithinimicrobium sp. F0845]
MSRIVFSVVGLSTSSGTTLGIQLKEPPAFGRQAVELSVSATDPTFQALHGVPPENAVREAGRVLFDALIANNPDLRKHIEAALLVQPPNRFPVFVELTTGGAEGFPWEALCTQDGDFLGLDERWAVGRIVESISPLPGTWLFEPPLRIAAVLSCLGVPGAPEWGALRAACEASEVPVELVVLVSEDALHQEISAAGLDWVTVEFVPSTVVDIAARLQTFNAHVLHMFCHGLSTGTSPHLQVATRADWLEGTASSLMVEARDLRSFNPPIDNLPWLVVLNSCETAAAGDPESARSVALDLIAEGGVPAVVGMREPVRSDDATLFTRAFYDQLLPEVNRLLDPERSADPVDWARLVVSAREQIAEQYEPLDAQRGTKKEWTLPVVYSRPASFQVQPVAPSAPVPPAPVPPAPDGPPPPDPGQAPPDAVQPPPPAPDPAAPAPGPGDRVRPPLDGQPGAGGAEQPPPEAGESSRSLALSVRALTGLRAQVEAAGDPEMLAHIDQEIARLQALLDGRRSP